MTKLIWALVHPSPAINVYPSSRLSPPDLWAPHGSTGGPHLEWPSSSCWVAKNAFWSSTFHLPIFGKGSSPKILDNKKRMWWARPGNVPFLDAFQQPVIILNPTNGSCVWGRSFSTWCCLQPQNFQFWCPRNCLEKKHFFEAGWRRSVIGGGFKDFLLFTAILRKVIQFDQNVSNGCLNHLTLDVVAWSTKTKGHQKKGPATMN